MKSNILIVDDIPKNLQVIASHLGDEEYELTMATSGEAALKALVQEHHDLVLLDINLPGIDGYEVCTRIKNNKDLKDIPIIFLTAKTEISDIVKGFEVGGVDYITKPFNKSELKIRVKTHLELYLLKEELKEKNKELEIAALTDHLTSLYNRRYILEFLKNEVARISRGTAYSGIIIMDIDNFKSFNDTYGHEAGDLILVEVSRVLKESIRINDKVARWGGEEFLVVLPETTLFDSRNVAEKIRSNIERLLIMYKETKLAVTITAGCSVLENKDIDSAINSADEKLYLGKEQGKNRVIG